MLLLKVSERRAVGNRRGYNYPVSLGVFRRTGRQVEHHEAEARAAVLRLNADDMLVVGDPARSSISSLCPVASPV